MCGFGHPNSLTVCPPDTAAWRLLEVLVPIGVSVLRHNAFAALDNTSIQTWVFFFFYRIRTDVMLACFANGRVAATT